MTLEVSLLDVTKVPWHLSVKTQLRCLILQEVLPDSQGWLPFHFASRGHWKCPWIVNANSWAAPHPSGVSGGTPTLEDRHSQLSISFCCLPSTQEALDASLDPEHSGAHSSSGILAGRKKRGTSGLASGAPLEPEAEDPVGNEQGASEVIRKNSTLKMVTR